MRRRRNTFWELTVGALVGATLIIVPAVRAQTTTPSSTTDRIQAPATTTQQAPTTPQPPAPDATTPQTDQQNNPTQLPQDQDQDRRDQDQRPVTQPPSTQLPQDKDQPRAQQQPPPPPPRNSSDEDPMVMQPKETPDNMGVQPRNPDDKMAVHPSDQTAAPSSAKPTDKCSDPDNDGDCHSTTGTKSPDDMKKGNKTHHRKGKKAVPTQNPNAGQNPNEPPK